MTTTLVEGLPVDAGIHLYGVLEGKPFTINNISKMFFGQKFEGYLLLVWWGKTSEEVKNSVKAKYSAYLKNELSTKTVKELTINDFEEALDLSIKKTAEGKVLMRPV